jgi:hypothetical protein
MATLLVLGVNGLMNSLETLLLRWRPPIDTMVET